MNGLIIVLSILTVCLVLNGVMLLGLFGSLTEVLESIYKVLAKGLDQCQPFDNDTDDGWSRK